MGKPYISTLGVLQASACATFLDGRTLANRLSSLTLWTPLVHVETFLNISETRFRNQIQRHIIPVDHFPGISGGHAILNPIAHLAIGSASSTIRLVV